MCTSYEPNPAERFDTFSLFPRPAFDYKPEIYKDYPGRFFAGSTGTSRQTPRRLDWSREGIFRPA